jgi:hypothetical protein
LWNPIATTTTEVDERYASYEETNHHDLRRTQKQTHHLPLIKAEEFERDLIIVKTNNTNTHCIVWFATSKVDHAVVLRVRVRNLEL